MSRAVLKRLYELNKESIDKAVIARILREQSDVAAQLPEVQTLDEEIKGF